MKMSAIRGRIARRVLINVRIKPDVLDAVLPPIFKPRLVDGWAIGGICFIALEEIRMPFLPAIFGMKSNNSAHRFAVYRLDDNQIETDLVYVPRRDTDSKLNIAAGRHLFPADLYPARFLVEDTGDSITLHVESTDHQADIDFRATVAENVQKGSVFNSVSELSDFFRLGKVGYSPQSRTGILDGVRLETDTWDGVPLAIERFESGFFADRNRFPEGSIELDSAYLMRGINHYWYREPSVQSVCSAC